MSKEAVLLIVDVGHSMDEPFSENASRAKIAFECCKLTLQQKLFNNSSHELGLMLFGDNDADDGNSLLLKNIEKPDVDFVRKVEELSNARFDNHHAGGDIFSTINYSIGLMNDHCGKKKYIKRLFLFTNGMGQTDFNDKEIRTLAKKIESSSIKINIIPIDFMTTYDSASNELEGEMILEPVQEKNAELLMKLKSYESNCVQIFPASLAIELYKKFRKRDTNPVARYKGSMELAPGLEIKVCTYKAIKRQKLKSLARYDTSVEFDPIIPEKKEVIVETNYIIQGDESGKIMEKENIINAYHYGPQLVPISSILEAGSKIFEDKNLRFLGFVDKSKIPRHCLMGEVDLVIPESDEYSRKLFTSFVYSMISLNKYAIARYVARNCKNGVVPRMVVLIPYRSVKREMFYLIDLPTTEDVRDYSFNSLKKSTDRQNELVKELINKMMLVNPDEQDGEEELMVENTFNPLRQYFYQTLFHKALNPDAAEIPPLDPVIRKHMTPEAEKFQKTRDMMKDMKKEFKLNRKLNLADKAAKKNVVVWKEVIEEMNKQMSTEIKLEEEEAEIEQGFVKPDFKFSMEDEEDEMKFNPSNPIGSFRKMVSYNREDLVLPALSQLSQYIQNKLDFSYTSQAYRHLFECASELRKACISQQQTKYWDTWFNALNVSNSNFYTYLRGEGLSVIEGYCKDEYKPIGGPRIDMEELICDLD